MIRMEFCGISGKRLWTKSGRHIIKPNHGVEQTPKIVPLKKFTFSEDLGFSRRMLTQTGYDAKTFNGPLA